MDFGLFTTWNAVYAGDKIPWDPDYRGGKLLEKEAYAQNWKEVQAVEDMGWDYIWLGGGHFSTQGSMDPQPLMLSAAIASRGWTGSWFTLVGTIPACLAASLLLAWPFHAYIERRFLNSAPTPVPLRATISPDLVQSDPELFLNRRPTDVA